MIRPLRPLFSLLVVALAGHNGACSSAASDGPRAAGGAPGSAGKPGTAGGSNTAGAFALGGASGASGSGTDNTSGVGNGVAGSASGNAGSSTGSAGSVGSTGGQTAAAGAAGSAGSGGGTCDAGTTTTTWASNCTTTPVACTAGTWIAGGPDPDHAGFKLISESAHFAVYSDENISAATAQSAVDYLDTTVWPTFFGSPLFMREPLCNSATKTKASIHVHSDWGLTGGSWATGRMGMWIGTGALNDHWGLAHEFTHGVQSVQGGMSCNQSNTCGWIYESHANWQAQQVPEYHNKDVHCSEMLANAPHLYLGSTRDRYCNWQFMEFLKDKYCPAAVNAIWTGTPAKDPFTAIMNARGWNVAQLNDFFGEWAMHNVTWDYQDPAPQSATANNQGALYRSKYGSTIDASKTERRLRVTKLEPLDTDYATQRRFMSPFHWAPQRWGYNVIRLYPEAGATSVNVTFRGLNQSGANADFRWGLVATDAGIAKPRYSKLQAGLDGALQFCVQPGEPLFLIVVATPSALQTVVWDQAYPTIYRYPYLVQFANAWPEGFQGGKPDACPSGLTRHENGGGCAPEATPASVYVGPYATILGGTVTGSARIEDHASVLKGTVSGGTIGALSLIGSNSANAFSVAGTAKVQTTFYPLGFFESGQGLSGSASLLGDVEYRGQGLNRSSGSFSGFVDESSASASMIEITTPPPYAWRP
ncbi:MAG TPA: DUF6055 domain-containing protein [Polyangiaceae bacterium]|nr:DUF6055 domain-containing protein [Polyangiaceae bacterium]